MVEIRRMELRFREFRLSGQVLLHQRRILKRQRSVLIAVSRQTVLCQYRRRQHGQHAAKCRKHGDDLLFHSVPPVSSDSSKYLIYCSAKPGKCQVFLQHFPHYGKQLAYTGYLPLTNPVKCAILDTDSIRRSDPVCP